MDRLPDPEREWLVSKDELLKVLIREYKKKDNSIVALYSQETREDNIVFEVCINIVQESNYKKEVLDRLDRLKASGLDGDDYRKARDVKIIDEFIERIKKM